MKPCPICARVVDSSVQNRGTSGFVVRTAGATYVVHGVCLSSFIKTLKASTSSWALDPIN